jgi:hypothetical protein
VPPQLSERQIRTRVINEVIRSVRPASVGKARDEVRNLVIAELDRRGVEPRPTDSVLEIMVASAISGTSPIARALFMAGSIGRISSIVGRKFTRPANGQRIDLYLDREPLDVEIDRSQPAGEVALDASAQAILGESRDSRNASGSHDVFVFLSADSAQPHIESVDVHIGRRRVGVLAGEAAGTYFTVIEAGKRLDRPVMTEAIQSQDTAGLWHLYVYPALQTSTTN